MEFRARVVILLSLIQFSKAGFSCSGMGRRWCDLEAVDEDECPKTCQKKYCEGRRPTKIISNGVSKYKSITWDQLVDTGLYQHVYVNNKHLCFGICWFKPWKATCEPGESRTYNGNSYCKALNCEHDNGNKVNDGNRFTGCHPDEKGKKKKPFHKPTCKECERVFPRACRHSSDDDSSDSSRPPASSDSKAQESSDSKAAESSDSKAAESSDSKAEESSDSVQEDSSDSSDNDGGSDKCKKCANKSDRYKKLECERKHCNIHANAAVTGFIDIDARQEALEAELERTTAAESFVPFDYAPHSWKILFLDEVNQDDVLVASVVNVIFQFANSFEEMDQKSLTDTMAKASGVDSTQVMLMHTFDNTERYALNAINEVANVTEIEWVTDHLLTVSVGIVSPNPEQMAGDIRVVPQDQWQDLFKAAGNLTFLEQSLTAEVKHISSSVLAPEALQHAKLLPASVVAGSLNVDEYKSEQVKAIAELSSSTGISKTVIIAGGVAGVLAICAAVILMITRRASPKHVSVKGAEVSKASN